MRFYRRHNNDDESRGMSRAERMGRIAGERHNTALQLFMGLDAMQKNIQNIRAMRQEKARQDKANLLADKQADLAIQKAELDMGPDSVAAMKEERKLRLKKAKTDSILQDRALQRAQMSEEERFKRSVDFIKAMNQYINQGGQSADGNGNDLFGFSATIDKNGNYVLSKNTQGSDKDAALAYKAKVETALKMPGVTNGIGDVDEEKFASALQKLGIANPNDSVSGQGDRSSASGNDDPIVRTGTDQDTGKKVGQTKSGKIVFIS